MAWTRGKGTVGLLQLTAAWLEPGVDSPQNDGATRVGRVREGLLTNCPRHGLWWKTRAPDLDI